jgi:hypothetical protein
MFKRKAKEPKIKKPRFQTFRDAYKVTKQVKPWITAALIGIFAVSWGIGIAIGSAIWPANLYLHLSRYLLLYSSLFSFSLVKPEPQLMHQLKVRSVRAQVF